MSSASPLDRLLIDIEGHRDYWSTSRVRETVPLPRSIGFFSVLPHTKKITSFHFLFDSLLSPLLSCFLEMFQINLTCPTLFSINGCDYSYVLGDVIDFCVFATLPSSLLSIMRFWTASSFHCTRLDLILLCGINRIAVLGALWKCIYGRSFLNILYVWFSLY